MKRLVIQQTDGKRFGFLNAKDKRQSKILEEINFILKLPSYAKPYNLNYDDVDEKYLLLGVGDIDEFSSSYTFGYAMLNGFINDRIVKHAIYEDIRNYLWSQNIGHDKLKMEIKNDSNNNNRRYHRRFGL